jgi:hypothetical protein
MTADVSPQDGSRLVGLAGGMDRDDSPPGLEFTLIENGFMLRDARSREGTEARADQGTCSGMRIGHRSCCDNIPAFGVSHDDADLALGLEVSC